MLIPCLSVSHTQNELLVEELIPVLGSHPAGDRSHKSGGRLPLLSASLAATSPATKHHCPLAGSKVYCLVTATCVQNVLTYACFESCTPLVNGCVKSTLFSAVPNVFHCHWSKRHDSTTNITYITCHNGSGRKMDKQVKTYTWMPFDIKKIICINIDAKLCIYLHTCFSLGSAATDRREGDSFISSWFLNLLV